MTVDAIRLQNFTAFEDTGWLELRPITLLFGRNSSGKSALIRALLLLRQSLKSAQEKDPFVFSDPYGVNIGGFQEMVNGGAVNKHVWFHFRCTNLSFGQVLAQIESDELRAHATPTLQIALGYAAHRETELVVREDTKRVEEVEKFDPQRIELTDLVLQLVGADGEVGDTLFRAMLLNSEDIAIFQDRWYVDGLLPNIDEPEAWKGFGIEFRQGFLDLKMVPPVAKTGNSYQQLEELLSLLESEIAVLLNGIVHLGPVRPEPQRRYSFSLATETEWRARGWTAFLEFIGRRLGDTPINEINWWLQELELAEGAEPRLASEYGSLVTEFEVAIRESKGSIPLPISAMGFGVSQVLPLIVQCVAARPGSLVIIEQPELHLHPRAQARFADVLIQTILREDLSDWTQKVKQALDKGSQLPPAPAPFPERETSAPYLLIETHSEHLLLRLRRRIAEKHAYEVKRQAGVEPAPTKKDISDWPLDATDLSFLFLYRDSTFASKIAKIGVDAQGELDPRDAPTLFDGFFSDDLEELVALVSAMP